MSEKVLVTGGAGFIGAHTAVELLLAGAKPIIMDDFSNSDERIIDGIARITGTAPVVIREDCSNRDALRKAVEEYGITSVIHFAAWKAVGESVAQPLKYYRNNLLSTLALLEIMQEKQINQMVFSSSCTVYGEPDVLPVTENTPWKTANSPYGYTKQVSERMITDFHAAQPGFSCVLLRYFNPIGAHPSGLIGELPRGVPNNLVPYITQTAAGIRPELLIYGNDYDTPDGTCIRDFIHVVDLAQAHVAALQWLKKNSGRCEAFNLGQGKGHSVMEVVSAFEKVTGRKLNYRIVGRRAGDVQHIWADVRKSYELMQWQTRLSVDDALRDAWKWQLTLANS